MRGFLQQHSFLLAAVLGMGGLSLAFLGTGLRPRRVGAMLAAGAALGSFYVIFRSGPSAASVAAVEQAIASGKPILVEVYSDY